MELCSVDLSRSMETCVSFRKDAHYISYGSFDGFNASETKAWFETLSQDSSDGFLHVFVEERVVGQLEFKSNILCEDGILRGYICLFYLVPEYRRKGLGTKLHEFVLSKFKQDGCAEANLRYVPGNAVAELFYLKHGWVPEGEAGERGQLMVKKIA